MFSWLSVFVAMALLDFVWAYYTDMIQQKKAALAALSASMIVLFNGVVVTGYVLDRWLLVPALLGAFLGTWSSVVFARRRGR